MTQNNKLSLEQLPPEIRAELEATPVLSRNDLDQLAQANRLIQADPQFQADLVKDLFVEEILDAMDAEGFNRAEVARRIGKSRQYLSKIFDQGVRTNFTIDSLASLACAVDRRLSVKLIDPRKMDRRVAPTPNRAGLDLFRSDSGHSSLASDSSG